MSPGRVLVKLMLRLGDDNLCNSLLEAVKVDDTNLPECVQILERKCEEGQLVYLFATSADKAEHVLRLWSTIDDLLRCLKAAYQALRKAES